MDQQAHFVPELMDRPKRLWRIKTYLLFLTFISLTPAIILAGFLIFRHAETERERREGALLDTVRAIRIGLDRDMSRAIDVLETLRVSELLQYASIDEFKRLAESVKRQNAHWTSIILVRPDGQQLMNLAARPGQALPNIGHYEVIKKVVSTNRPAISELLFGIVGGFHLVGIDVPVFKNDELQFILGMSMPASYFEHLLKDQTLPNGYIAVLLDYKWVTVARSDSTKFVGRKASAWAERAISERPEGVTYGTTREGQAVVFVHSRSELSGWTVGIGVPTTVFGANARTSLLYLAAGALLLLALALFAAYQIIRRIAGPTAQLVRAAHLYQKTGELAPITDIPVRELQDLASGLRRAVVARETVEADKREAASEKAKREEAERQANLLSLSEKRFRSLVAGTSAVVWRADEQGNFIDSEPGWNRLTGQLSSEAEGRGWLEALEESDRPRVTKGWHEAVLVGAPFRMEARVWNEVQAAYWHFEIRAVPISDRNGVIVEWIGNLQDVTERIITEQRKELLRREIDHRVKNSLQMVAALLSIQSRKIADVRVEEEFDLARERVAAIARIHDRLQFADSEDRVQIADFLRDLCGDIVRLSGAKCTVESDRLEIPVNLAATLGLVVNELCSNVLKHAHTNPTDAHIWVRCRVEGSARMRLEISDNGSEFDAQKAASSRGLGLRVVDSLISKESGTIELRRTESGGALAEITIPLQSA